MFGGMFDPPHVGHMILANEAAWQLGLDEVRLVVTARPSHRRSGWLPPERRLRLVTAAVAPYPALVASRAEIDRPGPSFMVDTLAGFVADEPHSEFWLILGADQVLAFSRWRDPAGIVALARLAVASRNELDRADLQQAADVVAPGRTDWLTMPAVGVSSTRIRQRIAAGEPVRHLVTPPVDDLLFAEGLPNAPDPLP